MRTLLGPVGNAAAIDVRSAGTLTVLMPSQQYPFMMHRMSIAGPVNSIAKVFVGQPQAYAFRSVSYFGYLDDADFEGGLYVPSNTNIIVAWYNVAPPNSILAPVNITNAAIGIATALAEIEAVL